MRNVFMVFVALISITIQAKPGNYRCVLTEDITFMSSDDVFQVNGFEIEFTVPQKNAPRVSDIHDIKVKYNLEGTDLVARATTVKFGEVGTVLLDVVEATQGATGGIDYHLGDSLLGYFNFSLNLPKLAKNINRVSEGYLWMLNNKRRIMSDFEMVCELN